MAEKGLGLHWCELSSTSGRRRSREEEDGRCLWQPSGNLSKKGELWLILVKKFELHLVRSLYSRDRSVLVDSGFMFFVRSCCFVEYLERGMFKAWTRISVLWKWQSVEF